jgi:hypothetical protein
MRKIMRGLGMAMLVAAALAGTPSPAASLFPIPVTKFYLSGTFEDGATLGGFLYIDITPPSGLPSDHFAGTVVTSFATITLPPPSSNVLSPENITTQGQITSDIYKVEVQTDDKLATMDLYLPVTTLLGYAGGPLISETHMAGQTMYISGYDVSGDPHLKMGQLSLASVPEPASLLLASLGGGVLGLGWVASRFRCRKAA